MSIERRVSRPLSDDVGGDVVGSGTLQSREMEELHSSGVLR
jgi:hypothetical protein